MTLPSSHNLSGDLAKVGDLPISVDGGTADVWEGAHDGRRVCIKCPRVCVEDLQAVTQVRAWYRRVSFVVAQEYPWTPQSFLKEAVIWKRLRHPNVVPFIGVTRKPLQFVLEYMENGTLTKYVGKYPSVNRIGLVSLSSGMIAWGITLSSLVTGCGRRSQLPSHKLYDTWRFERGR